MELMFIDNYQCPGKTNAGHNHLRYQKSRSSLIFGMFSIKCPNFSTTNKQDGDPSRENFQHNFLSNVYDGSANVLKKSTNTFLAPWMRRLALMTLTRPMRSQIDANKAVITGKENI